MRLFFTSPQFIGGFGVLDSFIDDTKCCCDTNNTTPASKIKFGKQYIQSFIEGGAYCMSTCASASIIEERAI